MKRRKILSVFLRQLEHKPQLLNQHWMHIGTVGPEQILQHLSLELLERRQANAFGAYAYLLLEAIVQLDGKRLMADKLVIFTNRSVLESLQ